MSDAKMIIKGTKTVDEYKHILALLQQYADAHGASVMRWEYGRVTADGVEIDSRLIGF